MNHQLPFIDSSFGSNTRFYQLGRHALADAFKAIGMQEGDEILIPSFICREVLAPIYQAQLVPVFYEVNNKLQAVDFPENHQAKAVIAVNYFGFPQDLSKFHQLSRQTGAILIEDNAHGYLSANTQNQFLGTRGDVGIFSPRKTLPLPHGAALLINNRELLGSLPQQRILDNTPNSLAFLIRRLSSKLQASYDIKLSWWLKLISRFFRKLRTGHAITPPDPSDEYEMPKTRGPKVDILPLLNNTDASKEITRRRDLYIRILVELKNAEITPIFSDLPENCAPYGIPFISDPQTAKLAVKIAHKHGLDCFKWPDLPKAIEHSIPAFYNQLWVINFLC